MKNLLPAMILFLTMINYQTVKPANADYIKIEYFSLVTTGFHRPILISKEKLKITLSKDEDEDFENGKKIVPTLDSYIALHYNVIETTSSSYKMMLRFLYSYKGNYSNSTPNPGYLITIIKDGKKHFFNIPISNGDNFFKDLEIYLKLHDCDKNLINQLKGKA